MKKNLLLIALALVAICGAQILTTQASTTCIPGYSGGTGICTTASSTVGQSLVVSSTDANGYVTWKLAAGSGGGTSTIYINNASGTAFLVYGDGKDVTSTTNGTSTIFALIPTGVSSGTYNCANVTVASSGRITAIAAGTCSGGGGSSTLIYAGDHILVNASGTNGYIIVNNGVTSTAGNWTGTWQGTNSSTYQTALGFTPAHSGANSDITSLSGLTTPLSAGQGGTATTTALGLCAFLNTCGSGGSGLTSITSGNPFLSVTYNASNATITATSTYVSSVNNATGSITITSSSLGVIYTPTTTITASGTTVNGNSFTFSSTTIIQPYVSGTNLYWAFINPGYISAAVTSINGDTTAAQKITGSGCITTSTTSGVTTIGSTCLTANQSITWTGSGDATGTATGATSLTPTLHVVALQGYSVTSTAPVTGTVLEYNGSTWLALSTSSLGLQAAGNYLTTVTADAPLGGNGTAGSHLTCTGCLTSAPTITLTGPVTGTGSGSFATTITSPMTVNVSTTQVTSTNVTVTSIAANSFVATDANHNLIATTTPSGGGVTTSTAGTTNTLPIWTSASALGNSHESESGTSTFINNSSTYFGTNTSAATSSLVWVSNYAGGGYWDATGTIPAISSCGSSPTSTGNQWRGRVVPGSGAPSACTITFPLSFVKTPSCMVDTEASGVTGLSFTPSTSTLVVSETALGTWDYNCVGQSE